MPHALTDGMSVLKVAASKALLLLSLVAALGSVACSGSDEQPAYAKTDIEAGQLAETGQPLRCEEGATRSCTIWLGQHGDLANCVHGLDICSEAAWTGCIDEDTLSANPNLYSDLVK
jgi:hypothetical protein